MAMMLSLGSVCPCVEDDTCSSHMGDVTAGTGCGDTKAPSTVLLLGDFSYHNIIMIVLYIICSIYN